MEFGKKKKKSNLNKIQAFQNITFQKITNVPLFIFNLTFRQDLGIIPVEIEAPLFKKRFFDKLENHYNPLIDNLHTFTLSSMQTQKKCYRDHLN